MKTLSPQTLLLAASLLLVAIVAIAGVAFAVGHGEDAPAQPQSPMSVPF